MQYLAIKHCPDKVFTCSSDKHAVGNPGVSSKRSYNSRLVHPRYFRWLDGRIQVKCDECGWVNAVCQDVYHTGVQMTLVQLPENRIERVMNPASGVTDLYYNPAPVTCIEDALSTSEGVLDALRQNKVLKIIPGKTLELSDDVKLPEMPCSLPVAYKALPQATAFIEDAVMWLLGKSREDAAAWLVKKEAA